MRFLIETVPGDVHAAAITCLLEKRGHQVDLFFYADFPAARTLSLSLSERGTEVRDQAGDVPRHLGAYRSAVLRRRQPHILSPDVHPADRRFSDQQCRVVETGLWAAMPDVEFWVNPPYSYQRAANKPVQLSEALKSGFKIPDTLISNNPDDILAFVGSRRAIYKPLKPAAWTSGSDVFLSFTEEVSPEQVATNRDALSLTPGIFQSFVNKAYEVRVVMFGTFAVALKIVTESRAGPVVDWRSLYFTGSGLVVEKYDLPTDVRARCVDLMRRLGITFGCFDLCVDHDGECHFLEVNQMGQFLWMDQATELSLISLFCDYIEGGSFDFDPGSTADDLRYLEVSKTERFQQLLAESHTHASTGEDLFTHDESERELQ